MKTAAAHGARAPYRLPVYLACTVLALVTNYFLGKDMASDALSYHLYAGFSAVHDRFPQDYFPAGPQSYFNPYVYVPLYYLVSSSLSSLEISSLLAIAHSIILWLTYELAVSVCPSDDRRQRLIFGLWGVAFALINPVLLQQIGSTFSDITTGEFVLAGWLLLALAVRAPSMVRVACAGLICGVATGLKLTNAVHAIAGFAMLTMLPLAPWRRARQGLAYGISLALGFLIIASPWSLRLERRFGNPLFPMLNNVFRSPEFTTETASATRFVPDSIAEALWRPFAMIDPVTMVHEEMRSPDARYAMLVILIGALLCRWLWRRRARAVPGADSASARVLTALAFGLVVDWAMWLGISGNSRYFLPMACVAAIVVVGLSYRLFEAQPKVRNYLLAGVLGIQGVQLWMGTDYRWNETAWDEHWINIEIPAELTSVANLFLTMGTPTNSFVALYLPPGSGLVNFTGLYTLSPDGANGARIASLVSRFAPNVRILVRGERLYRKDERRMPTAAQIDDALRPFSLRIDENDCATITVHGLPPGLEITMAASQPAVPQSPDTTYLLTCRVTPDNTDHSAQIAQHRDIDLALDHLEDACPALFQPRRPRTEFSGKGGLRRYIGSDVMAWVSNGRVKFLQPMLGGDVVVVGFEDEWAKAPIPLECGRRNGRYFATPATLQ